MVALIGHSNELQSVTISHHGQTLVNSSVEARVVAVSVGGQRENSDYC